MTNLMTQIQMTHYEQPREIVYKARSKEVLINICKTAMADGHDFAVIRAHPYHLTFLSMNAERTSIMDGAVIKECQPDIRDQMPVFGTTYRNILENLKTVIHDQEVIISVKYTVWRDRPAFKMSFNGQEPFYCFLKDAERVYNDISQAMIRMEYEENEYETHIVVEPEDAHYAAGTACNFGDYGLLAPVGDDQQPAFVVKSEGHAVCEEIIPNGSDSPAMIREDPEVVPLKRLTMILDSLSWVKYRSHEWVLGRPDNVMHIDVQRDDDPSIDMYLKLKGTF